MFFNIGTGVETTIADAAGFLVGHVKPTALIQFTGQHRAGDPDNWRADISKISELGFRPQVSLKSGLGEFAKWVTGLPQA